MSYSQSTEVTDWLRNYSSPNENLSWWNALEHEQPRKALDICNLIPSDSLPGLLNMWTYLDIHRSSNFSWYHWFSRNAQFPSLRTEVIESFRKSCYASWPALVIESQIEIKHSCLLCLYSFVYCVIFDNNPRQPLNPVVFTDKSLTTKFNWEYRRQWRHIIKEYRIDSEKA